MSNQKPITYQFIIERWADGLKVLGAGNGAGLLASGASLQFFAAKPELLTSIKSRAGFFLAGLLSFALAFFVLTVLPLTIEHFLASSEKIYKEFKDMITDLMLTNKNDARAYIALVMTSLFSFICFMAGSLYIVAKCHIVFFETSVFYLPYNTGNPLDFVGEKIPAKMLTRIIATENEQ